MKLSKQFGHGSGQTRCVQTGSHSDSIPDESFNKDNFEKRNRPSIQKVYSTEADT